MKRFNIILIVLLSAVVQAWGCTSAIVGSKRSASGASLLWKHRDTSAPHNFIAHHAATDSTFEYIALHNVGDTGGAEAWMGMNRAGFAVMNTASYNLAPDTATVKDREGLVMTRALQVCRNVADFCTLLDTLPRPLGVQANFGTIDAAGNRLYLETNDNGYRVYEVADTMATVRTNYSHSGASKPKLGLAREVAAVKKLSAMPVIPVATFTDTLSRQLIDHTTMKNPARSRTIDKGDYIPRYISTASIVIEALPSATGDGSGYVMWTMLGYPPCAQVYKVTFDSIPAEVLPAGDGITPAERSADSLKSRIFTGKKHGKHREINLNEYNSIVKKCQHH